MTGIDYCQFFILAFVIDITFHAVLASATLYLF